MTTLRNEKFFVTAEKELTAQFIRLTNGEMNLDEASRLARNTISKIDWKNSALMHKGMSWIAKYVMENQVSISV